MSFSTVGIGIHEDDKHSGTAKKGDSGGVQGLLFGLDAAKTATPAVGQMYHATDTSKTYACFAVNVWTDVSATHAALTASTHGVGASGFEDKANKNAASGYAGLDANSLLTPAQEYPCYEEYQNHVGATDNYTTSGVGGTSASAAADATNHEFDLSASCAGAGTSWAYFKVKDGVALATKPIVVNLRIRNTGQGTGPVGYLGAGLLADWTNPSVLNNGCIIEKIDNGAWTLRTGNGTASTDTTFTFADNDLITIIATSASVKYFQNGTLIATHTTTIPTAALSLGAGVWGPAGGAGNSALSINQIGWKRYV